MKYLLLILLLALLFFMLGVKRARPPAPKGESARRPEQAEAQPQSMVSCAQCGLHLPRDEALPGQGGVFCGSAHRAAFEQVQQAKHAQQGAEHGHKP
ncbi:PP0621 family protein [Paucibacter sp. AS339]|uniref:PP0621 family protein n=1 Tax=Paucibacter hankyongi TaxID=3133434 RepID=UPI0030AA55E0